MFKKINLSDFIWNLGSTGVIAIGGFLLSSIIAFSFNPNILGVFNESYAYYIVLSQITSLGIHTATLKTVAQYSENHQMQKTILSTALSLSLIVSLAISFFIFLAANLLIIDEAFLLSIKYVTIALPIFSLNKTLMGYFNGKKQMKAYAIFQALRVVFLVLYLVILIFINFPPYEISLIFTLSELSVLIIAFLYTTIQKSISLKFDKRIAKSLLKFGIQIIPGNIVLEFNTKADIICLGLLTGNDYLVGTYSFATLFAEGMYQMYTIMRRLINPDITKFYYNSFSIISIVEKLNKKLYKVRIIGSMLLFAAVNVSYFVICILLNQNEYQVAIPSLIILTASIALNSKGIIFGNIFSQVGAPIKESKVNIITLLTNALLNLAFIPLWGIIGAAVATATSYFVFSFYQHYLIYRTVKKKGV